MEFGGIRRRSFVKGAVGAAMAGGLASAQASVPAATASPEAWDERFDVIVVGSGVAGLVAAIVAAEAGNKTLVIEKMPITGGSSRISQCDMSIVGSPHQAREGVEDKPEWLAADMVKVSGGMTDPDFALAIAKGTKELYHFLEKRGVVFSEKLMKFGGHSAKRAVFPVGGGKGMVEPLQAHFEKLSGTSLRVRVKAEEVVKDGTGRVVGLAVRENYLFDPNLSDEDVMNSSGRQRRYLARKGVVFASGGFCRDQKMVTTEAPYLRGISSNAQVGANGSGVRGLISSGAYMMHMSMFRFSFPISFTDLVWGMYVDPATGTRFVNEGAGRDVISNGILSREQKNGGRTPVVIWDSQCIKNFHDTRRLNRGLAGKNTCGGNILKFDSLDDLAKHYGIDAAALKQSAAQYNASVDAAADPAFGKNMKSMKGAGIRVAPYYAMQARPFIAYTAGGARITTRAEVVSANDWKVIPGLYAAGEAAGGVHGANRLTSCSVIDCGVFGMIAGREVAKNLPQGQGVGA